MARNPFGPSTLYLTSRITFESSCGPLRNLTLLVPCQLASATSGIPAAAVQSTYTVMAADHPILKSVLISGGTGFVGSAIARALAEQHPECAITVLDLKPPDSIHVLPESASFVQADVTSLDDLKCAVMRIKPDVFCHTAGVVPVLSERYGRRLEQMVWNVNVDGTKNALEAAKCAGAPVFIYTSTCCTITDDMRLAYPNIDESWPTSRSSLIYGESKVLRT